MAKEKTSEEKLQELAKRLQSGASVLHPVTEKEFDAVRKEVKRQEQEKKAAKEREQERDRGR
jgi:hypothetical protein